MQKLKKALSQLAKKATIVKKKTEPLEPIGKTGGKPIGKSGGNSGGKAGKKATPGAAPKKVFAQAKKPPEKSAAAVSSKIDNKKKTSSTQVGTKPTDSAKSTVVRPGGKKPADTATAKSQVNAKTASSTVSKASGSAVTKASPPTVSKASPPTVSKASPPTVSKASPLAPLKKPMATEVGLVAEKKSKGKKDQAGSSETEISSTAVAFSAATFVVTSDAVAVDDDVVLTDADGRRYCRMKDCDQAASVGGGYCRFHYLLFWKNIQNRKKILSEGKLERYIEELTARYPDKYLELLRKDLRSEKDFTAAIQELEIDESGVDNEFEDEAQNYLDEVRGMSSESQPERDEDF